VPFLEGMHMRRVTKAARTGCLRGGPLARVPATGPRGSFNMARSLVLLSLILSLTGCGVAETGTAAATAATAKAEEARQGLQTEATVREQLDAASKQAAELRKAADQ